MVASSKNIDINNELLIYQYSNGIKLNKPIETLPKKNGLTVATFLAMPFNTYILNHESVIQRINEQTVNTCGFYSIDDAIGRTIRDVSNHETANKLIEHDQIVMKEKSMKIFDDYHIALNSNETDHTAISLKFPWYDTDDKVIGVFGCSIVVGKQSITNALSQIKQFGWLDKETNYFLSTAFKENDFSLSKREIEILRYTVYGMMAKQIALKLNLSCRTVEHHLENIKIKMKVSSKSQLIEKAHIYFQF